MKTFRFLSTLCVFVTMVFAAQSKVQAVTATIPGNFSQACGTGGNGCFRVSNTTSNSSGIVAEVASGTAMTAKANAGGVGVTGQALNAYGLGVQGLNTGSAGGIGVFGQSTTGIGVSGFSSSNIAVQGYGGGIGVEGETSGASVAAVQGENTSATGFPQGVLGRVKATSGGSAIYGDAANSGSAWAGQFVGDVNVTGFYYVNGVALSSDARLKKDIKDAPYGLEQVLKLRPVTYKWKQEGSDQSTQLGLVAQEVQKIVPEVVRTNRASGMLAVSYTSLIPVMVKAAQEQQNLIARQQAFIERQDARIAALERGQAPLTSVFSGGLGGGLALGFLPLGLLLALRRRRRD